MDFSAGPVRHTVADDTMAPALLKGDELLVYPLERSPKLKDVLLVEWKGERLLRRVKGSVHEAALNKFLVQLACDKKGEVIALPEENILGKVECS